MLKLNQIHSALQWFGPEVQQLQFILFKGLLGKNKRFTQVTKAVRKRSASQLWVSVFM